MIVDTIVNRIHLLTAVILLVLVMYAITGLFAYPEADDVMFIDLAHSGQNVLESQYYGWQGRYNYSLLMGVYMPLAPNLVVKTFPALLIAGLLWVLYRILRRFVIHPLLAASGLTLGFLAVLPNMWQSLYWYGASTNYIVPLILAGGLLLWLWR